jgi:hypothetical protein
MVILLYKKDCAIKNQVNPNYIALQKANPIAIERQARLI